MKNRIRLTGRAIHLSASNAPVAQLDRASVFGTEGCRFESCRVYLVFFGKQSNFKFGFSPRPRSCPRTSVRIPVRESMAVDLKLSANSSFASVVFLSLDSNRGVLLWLISQSRFSKRLARAGTSKSIASKLSLDSIKKKHSSYTTS